MDIKSQLNLLLLLHGLPHKPSSFNLSYVVNILFILLSIRKWKVVGISKYLRDHNVLATATLSNDWEGHSASANIDRLGDYYYYYYGYRQNKRTKELHLLVPSCRVVSVEQTTRDKKIFHESVRPHK